MQESSPFNWLQSTSPVARPVDIKVESSTLELTAFSLLSPPSSPSRSVPTSAAAFPLPTATRRRSNTSALTSPKRVKPYPSSTRESRVRDESAQMANNSSYGTWSGTKSGGGKTHYAAAQAVPIRRSSDGDQQVPPYPVPDAFVPNSFVGRSSARDARPPSSSSSMTTSSLTGAMGDTHLSSHSQHSDSPSPTSDQPYSLNMHSSMVWQQSQPHTMAGGSTSHSSYPTGTHGQSGGSLPYHALSSSTSTPYVPYQDYNHSSTYHNPSPESISPHSPAFASSSYTGQQMAFQSSRAQLSVQTRPHGIHSPSDSSFTANDSMALCPPSTATSSSQVQSRPPTRVAQGKFEDEIIYLRKTVRDLELINESARRRIRQLETELTKDAPVPSTSHTAASSSGMSGLPSPLLTPSPQSATFHAAWRARTDARVRQFCSLNRAGNALCAWHDSRRERRAHPPRMAPPGHLNCGCTYEEALFEESLARHGVGSYHPGEMVRMDPALRNPLLKLLEQRYGYMDGDFERDPATGNWVEGEGPGYWEARALSGVPHARKNRTESDRR